MPDPFDSFADSTMSPSEWPFAVAPHDVNELVTIPKALYVGVAGHIVLRGSASAADVVFQNVPAGSILPVRAQFVRATGTTAANIVALA